MTRPIDRLVVATLADGGGTAVVSTCPAYKSFGEGRDMTFLTEDGPVEFHDELGQPAPFPEWACVLHVPTEDETEKAVSEAKAYVEGNFGRLLEEKTRRIELLAEAHLESVHLKAKAAYPRGGRSDEGR